MPRQLEVKGRKKRKSREEKSRRLENPKGNKKR